VATTDHHSFHLHKGLLARSFSNSIAVDHFIDKINGKFSKKTLETMIGKLYRGYGSFTKQDQSEYGLSLPHSLEDYEE
jgi:hypothetical protein